MTSTPLIVGLGGSLRARSYSRLALQTALAMTAEQGAEVELLDVKELDLPMFYPDMPVGAYSVFQQPAIVRLVETCRRADAMIWASPTYHGTVSGVVKNALDFLELLSDDDPPYLTGRAVGLIAVSDQSTFPAMIEAVYELRAWLTPTRVTVNRRDFDAEHTLVNERVEHRLRRMVGELLAFAHRHDKS
jgi:FMN reductase